MPDPILFLFFLFHAWHPITFAWTWWNGTDPGKKTYVIDKVNEDSREPALNIDNSN